MPIHDIVVIGASAGGVEALSTLAAGLPADLPAAVFVVIHFPPDGFSVLPRILRRSGPLPVEHAVDGESVRPGRIYVAPPNHHLTLHDGVVRLTRGPRENGHRPAIDTLFRSAARWYGSRAIGVVLSGVLDDGTAGLLAVKMRGGVALVQDPADALYPGMPQSAIENVDVDEVWPLADMPSAIRRWVAKPATSASAPSNSTTISRETEITEMARDEFNDPDRPGTPSEFACPECGGALFELRDGQFVRYRCRVGHAWTSDTLLAEQGIAVEEALWAAIRALEERAALSKRMCEGARGRGHDISALRFATDAEEAISRADVIRQVLRKGLTLNPEGDEDMERQQAAS